MLGIWRELGGGSVPGADTAYLGPDAKMVFQAADQPGRRNAMVIIVDVYPNARISFSMLRSVFKLLATLFLKHGAIKCSIGVFEGPILLGDIIVRGPWVDRREGTRSGESTPDLSDG